MREAPRLAPDPTAPPRHEPDEPEREHHWKQEDEVLRDEERECAEYDGEPQRDPDHSEPVVPHVAHDPPVVVGWDLRRVPATSAVLARPRIAVRDELDPPAVAGNRDRGALHGDDRSRISVA